MSQRAERILLSAKSSALDLPICAVHSSWPGAVVAPQALIQSVCRVVGATGRHGTERGNPTHPAFEEMVSCVPVRTCMLEAYNRCQQMVSSFRSWLEMLFLGNYLIVLRTI